LGKPRTTKRIDKLWERIGRLKAKSCGIGQHYERKPVAGSSLTHPGIYCLRSSETDRDAQKLWRTYTMLTDLESVFRSLKSELGLRPVFHHKEERADGHLFITVLAYQFVQIIRRQLHDKGINASWRTLRQWLSGKDKAPAYTERFLYDQDRRVMGQTKCPYHPAATGLSAKTTIDATTVRVDTPSHRATTHVS